MHHPHKNTFNQFTRGLGGIENCVKYSNRAIYGGFSCKWKMISDFSVLFSVSWRVIYMGLTKEENAFARKVAKIPTAAKVSKLSEVR